MSDLDLPYSSLISTGLQSRETDRRTIDTFGIDGFTLMESAALSAASVIGEREVRGAAGLFVCGKGNNAGDALATARYLSIQHDHRCHIWFPAGQDSLSEDAEQNLQLLQNLEQGGQQISVQSGGRNPSSGLQGVDYLVDGLLGTGVSSEVRSPYREAIEQINRFPARCYAMDLPSGLDPDRGQPLGTVVQADVTFSFGSLKPGFYMTPGRRFSGEVILCPLSFPPHLREGVAWLLDSSSEALFPEPVRTARHKYDGGVVYVAAGSEGLTGAAILAARSAWKAGAGAVFLLAPRGLLPVYEATLPDIIKIPVGEPDDRHLLPAHLAPLLSEREKRPGVLLAGPGLGRQEQTINAVEQLMRSWNGPAVVDADAISVLANGGRDTSSPLIATPHPGELGAWMDPAPKDAYDRLLSVTQLAAQEEIHIVSKGSPTIVGRTDGLPLIAGYDSTLFSRAGFGDLLSGSIAARLAVTGRPDSAIVHALLDGYNKAKAFLERTGRPPAPGDLL